MTVQIGLVCGPPGVFGRTERTCWECKTTGPHISQWLGYGYGHDHHCLTCRITDQDGYIETPTAETIAKWDEIAEHFVLPDDLYQRYEETDLAFYGPQNQTVADERRWLEAMTAVKVEVFAHHARARAAIAAIEEA